MDNESKKLVAPILSAVFGYSAECRARVATNHAALSALLRERGVAVVRAHYEGSGDSGQFEEFEIVDAGGRAGDEKLSAEEEARLKGHFYDLLECRHGGWENNEGGYGDFQWTVTSDELTHDHNDYFQDVENTYHEGYADIFPNTGEGVES
jgi:hypothetical protein